MLRVVYGRIFAVGAMGHQRGTCVIRLNAIMVEFCGMALNLPRLANSRAERCSTKGCDMADGNGAKWIWRITRLAIYSRDGFSCAYCGSSDGLSLDHLTPRSHKNGHNRPTNLITACVKCNASKGNRPWRIFAQDDRIIKRINRLRRRSLKSHRIWARGVMAECKWSVAIRQTSE